MRTIRTVCRPALPVGAVVCSVVALVLAGGLGGAYAQAVDVRQACTPDAMRLCNQFIPDEAKITSCMMAKKRQLSPECRTAMAGGSHRGGHHRGHGHHHRHG
jgi:hypothetical protein